jgi:hypothetical protein
MPLQVFQGNHASCRWDGQSYTTDELEEMRPALAERTLDLAFVEEVAARLEGLASTGLALGWLEDFLSEGTDTVVAHWQVGEAFAQLMLETERGAVFPWNTRRDERTPKASLPGADIVGLSLEDGEVRMLFGEAKSSSDLASPPQVLYGKSGMTAQLERLVDEPAIQFKLIQWLMARIPDGALGDAFDQALALFVNSQGAEVRITGVLVRDTNPGEDDVKARAEKLGDHVQLPTTVELVALYLPIGMDEWPSLVEAA